jgi:hypothetical protein
MKMIFAALLLASTMLFAQAAPPANGAQCSGPKCSECCKGKCEDCCKGKPCDKCQKGTNDKQAKTDCCAGGRCNRKAHNQKAS